MNAEEWDMKWKKAGHERKRKAQNSQKNETKREKKSQIMPAVMELLKLCSHSQTPWDIHSPIFFAFEKTPHSGRSPTFLFGHHSQEIMHAAVNYRHPPCFDARNADCKE